MPIPETEKIVIPDGYITIYLKHTPNMQFIAKPAVLGNGIRINFSSMKYWHKCFVGVTISFVNGGFVQWPMSNILAVEWVTNSLDVVEALHRNRCQDVLCEGC